MHIVLSADNNYAPLLGVTVFSLLEKNKNYPKEINIYVLDMDIDKLNIDKLNSIIEKYRNRKIHYIKTKGIHDYLQNNIKLPVRSLATYYRLFLPSLLPETIDKVIYLDCDSLVNDSLEDLWNLSIKKYDIAGVLDIISEDNKLCIGLTEKDPYLNAGMLVINLKKWRKDQMQKKMIDFIMERHGKVCYHDQGTINGVCLHKKILHPKYNVMTPFYIMKLDQLKHYHSLKNYYTQKEVVDAVKKPVFIHFTPYLTDRPWVKNNLHPLRKYYNEIMNKTPWRGTRFNKPSKTLEPWVKWLFYLLPYPIFIIILKSLQNFKLKTWVKKIFKQ